MPQNATCPTCRDSFPVTEARDAFSVACPKCDSEMTVEFKKHAAPPQAGQSPYELLVRSSKQPSATTPLSIAKKQKDDDDEPKRKGGSAMVVLLSGGFGLMIVLGGLALTAWFLFTQIDMTETASDSGINRSSNSSLNSANRFNSSPRPDFSVVPNPNINHNPNPKPIGANNPRSQPKVGTPPRVEPDTPQKPKDEFDLRPVAGTLPPIAVPNTIDAATPQMLLLPGTVDRSVIGGGGRYIVFHCPQQGRLLLFDANTCTLTDNTSIATGNVIMAAGANVLVTTVPNSKNLRVYTLPDLKQQNEFEIPLFHHARGMAMGSRTNGPLFVVDPFGRVILMDIATGKVIEGSEQELSIASNQLRATPDGTMFLASNGYNSRDRVKMIDESLRKWQVKEPDIFAAYPSADGKLIYGKDQIITTTGSVVATKPAALAHVWYVPAVTATGNYFLKVNEVKIGTSPRTKTAVSIAIHKDKNVDKPVLTAWEGLPETERLVQSFGASEPLDQHLFLIPDAKVLVILNREKTRLHVRKLNLP